MPFKSKAQRRKFAELLVKGEISPETYEEWNRETGGAELPERVKPKKKRAVRKKAKGKARRSTLASRKRNSGRRKSVTRRKRSTTRRKVSARAKSARRRA